jgi:hypothetical protein
MNGQKTKTNQSNLTDLIHFTDQLIVMIVNYDVPFTNSTSKQPIHDSIIKNQPQPTHQNQNLELREDKEIIHSTLSDGRSRSLPQCRFRFFVVSSWDVSRDDQMEYLGWIGQSFSSQNGLHVDRHLKIQWH